MINKNKTPSIKDDFSRKLDANLVAVPTENKVPFKTDCTNPEEIKRLEELTSRLAKSEEGKKSLDFLYKNNYKINLKKLPSGYDGLLNNDKSQVLLNENNNNNSLISILTHETRHAIQSKNEENKIYPTLSPETATSIMYIKEADADAMSSLVCWQLKEKGDTTPWNEETKSRHEMTQAFENSINKGESKEQTLTKTFDAWFKNTFLINDYNKDYIDYINDELNENPEFYKSPEAFSKSIPVQDLINNICGCDGNNYFKGDNNDPKYQHIQKEPLQELQNMMSYREEETGIKSPKGMKVLWDNLKKIENGENKSDKTQLIANLKNNKTH